MSKISLLDKDSILSRMTTKEFSNGLRSEFRILSNIIRYQFSDGISESDLNTLCRDEKSDVANSKTDINDTI